MMSRLEKSLLETACAVKPLYSTNIKRDRNVNTGGYTEVVKSQEWSLAHQLGSLCTSHIHCADMRIWIFFFLRLILVF